MTLWTSYGRRPRTGSAPCSPTSRRASSSGDRRGEPGTRAPMAGVTPLRGGLFVGGNIALFVFSMLAAPYPEGDPGKAREAAKVWAELMGDIVGWAENGDDAAQAITSHNAGESIQ